MQDRQELCRICLQHGKIYQSESFQMVLNEIYKDIIHWDIQEKDKIQFCDKCTITLEMAFEFKAQCAKADEYLYPYLKSAKNEKLSLTEIYSKSKNINRNNLKICRICLKASESCDTSSSFIKSQNKDIIKKYIPSLHGNDVKDGYICNTCSTNAVWFIKFIINCLESEKKLINYLKEKNKNIETKLSNKTSIEHHEKEHHRNTKHYNCINCDFKIQKSILLQKHLRPHIYKSNKKYLNCLLCSFVTTNIESYQDHFKKQHSCNNDRLHCDLCSYNSKDRSHLFRHWKSFHMDRSEVELFKCDVCIFECIDKSNLKKHMIKHLGQKEFKCSICDFSTSYEYSLKLHIKNHEGIPENFKCDTCSFSTKLKSNLIAHIRFVHNNNDCNKHACHICNFKTNRKGNLVHHLKLHDNNFYYKCEYCKFQTKHKAVLKKHNQFMHADRNEVRTFNCDLCSYKTIEKGNLTRHKLVHDTKITLKCSKCNFSTKYKYSLKTHMASHKGTLKKFKCDSCNYTTAFRTNLKSHYTLLHDTNCVMYECYKCSFKAKLKSILISHIKTHDK